MTIQAQGSVSASITASINIDVNASITAHTAPVSNPTHASTVKEGGQVKFENDNYRITAGDNNEVNIVDKHTGETTHVWGDPHVDVNGKHAFDFWGTTTFNLKDGTKVTIETTPLNSNPSVTLASKVTITNGDYGVQIKGVDTNKVGDLSFEEGKGWGKLIDATTSDGNELYAKQNGGGYVGVDDKGHVRNVDQNFINETDLKKGGAFKDQLQNAFSRLSSLISIIVQGRFAGSAGSDGGHESAPQHHHHHHGVHHGHFHFHIPRDFPPVAQPKLPHVDFGGVNFLLEKTTVVQAHVTARA